MKNDFIKYYEEKNISPVKQDISNLQLHCRRRGNCIVSLEYLLVFFRINIFWELGLGVDIMPWYFC